MEGESIIYFLSSTTIFYHRPSTKPSNMLYLPEMFPILLTIGNFPISSFGLFLGLGIFFGSFTVWRIARSFDFEVEKVLDLIFLTLGAGFIFSRLVFVLSNFEVFDSFTKIFFINRYPGLSFWGGFLGGFLTLWWFSKRSRIAFFQAADIAMIGFFIAAFFAQIGCLLGACGVGIPIASFIGVDQAGVIGKRLPIQLFEALVFLVIFLSLWKAILRFHVQGSFLAKGLMLLGLTKLAAEFFKTQPQVFQVGNFPVRLEIIFSTITFGLGLYFHYKIYKKTPIGDLALFFKFFVSRSMQKSLMTKIIRGWYNQKANLTVGFGRMGKKLFKLLNIRSNPEKF